MFHGDGQLSWWLIQPISIYSWVKCTLDHMKKIHANTTPENQRRLDNPLRHGQPFFVCPFHLGFLAGRARTTAARGTVPTNKEEL